MDKKERNKIRFKRIYIPMFIGVLLIIPFSFFDIKYEKAIGFTLLELILIFIIVYGFIFGNLLKNTTPGFIIARIIFVGMILQVMGVISVLLILIKW